MLLKKVDASGTLCQNANSYAKIFYACQKPQRMRRKQRPKCRKLTRETVTDSASRVVLEPVPESNVYIPWRTVFLPGMAKKEKEMQKL